MKRIWWPLLILCSCVHGDREAGPTSEVITKNSKATISINSSPEPLKPLWREVEIKQGSVLWMQLPLKERGTLRCEKKEIPTFFNNGQLSFFLSVSYFDFQRKFLCEIKTSEDILLAGLWVHVKTKKFPESKLNVDKKKVVYDKKDLPRIISEQKEIKATYKNSSPRPYFQQSFQRPIDSLITSIYGTRRIFNNLKKSQHLGTDYRAAVGTSIQSSHRGRVILAKDLFFSGQTVIVDHGLGVFTMYGHLSAIQVEKGQLVEQGQVLGLAGKTGRVTGPHLHWGVKIHGHWVDGEDLLEQEINFL